MQEKDANYIPASGLCDHKLPDVLDDVLEHEMVTDGVWVVGEDPHQPLQEECPAQESVIKPSEDEQSVCQQQL